MRTGAMLALQLLCDSGLPTGAFTGSMGWEAAARDGALVGEDGVREWLACALEEGLSGVELPHAARAWRSPTPWTVDAQLERWVTVGAWGRASRAVGSRMLALSGRRARPCHRAAAAGWLGGQEGVPVVAALAAHAQAVLVGQTQVAVRLGSISGDAAVGLVRSLQPAIVGAAERAADGRVRPVLAIAHELYGLRQGSLPCRLFAS